MSVTASKLPLTMLLMIAVVSSISLLPVQEAKAISGKIFSDPSDGFVYNVGTVAASMSDLYVGDTSTNAYSHGFVKFSLSGISGTLTSAKLNLYVVHCFHDSNVPIISSPLPNIGLGNCRVIHIADYGTLTAATFSASSIGNDPGVILSNTATPNIGYVSIDVTTAMQDDISKGRQWSAFMILLETSTDSDNLNDGWAFFASEMTGTAYDPYIEYQITPSPSPKPCVIATAAYDSPLAQEVTYMRHVRDDLIGSTNIGQVLIRYWNLFYYSWSPAVAQLIDGSDALKFTSRILLMPLLGITHITAKVYAGLVWLNPQLASTAAFTIAAVLSTTVYLISPFLIFKGKMKLVRKIIDRE